MHMRTQQWKLYRQAFSYALIWKQWRRLNRTQIGVKQRKNETRNPINTAPTHAQLLAKNFQKGYPGRQYNFYTNVSKINRIKELKTRITKDRTKTIQHNRVPTRHGLPELHPGTCHPLQY